MKFGGTSVIDAQRISNVASLITQSVAKQPTAVVLSAIKGTTDHLLEVATLAIQHIDTNTSYETLYKKMYTRHMQVWIELVAFANSTLEAHPFPKQAQDIFDELSEILHGISLIKECTERTKDLMLCFGERLSCCLCSNYLNISEHNIQASMVDSRECIVTNDRHGMAGVLFEKSYKLLHERITALIHNNIVPIITGFIGATEDGITTTLGRNGSDYTAALVGAALNADHIEIWTDVDGVLSADPRITSQAFVLPNISYNEAMELSYFGANVIHPQTVVPAIEKKVPIIIKNTLNPSAEGTMISFNTPNKTFPITGLTSVKEINMLTIEGAGLSGNFYLLPDVFNVFATYHIHPLMITQASSEHSISFVLNASDISLIKKRLTERFAEELASRRIQDISVISDISIISVIGSQMSGTKGLVGKIFSAMGDNNINVIAIAQGSNEINVSFVIEKQYEKNAISILHNTFFTE